MRSGLSAPQVAFSPPPGLQLPGPPQLLFSTGLVARNGLSLARNGSPFRGLHSGVNVPGLLLRHRLSRSQTRSAFCSTTASGSPRSRPLPRFGPLPVRFLARSTLPPASTPLQDVYIPPDRSVQPASRQSVRLPAPPDFLSLPVSSSISSLGNGSSFLVRYVSGGLLFLKPLGTSFTMRLPKHRVNKYLGENPIFHQNLFCFISVTCRHCQCVTCGKNRMLRRRFPAFRGRCTSRRSH